MLEFQRISKLPDFLQKPRIFDKSAGIGLDRRRGVTTHPDRGSLGLLESQSEKTIGAVSEKGDPNNNGWRRMSFAVDSGACATVADPSELLNYEVKETTASKAGECFTAASGDPIPNLGGMRAPIVTRESTNRLMQATAAPVTKPLLSVKQLCRMGHVVVFEESCSYIINKNTNECNYLREDNGNFMLDVWVPPNPELGFVGPQ